MRAWLGFAGVSLVFFAVAGAEPETNAVTWTGWFSDAACAGSRAKSGTFTATNPDCAKKCIEKGEGTVFISEQAKALYTVTGYASAVEDLGYHLEVQATVDEAAKRMTIRSVKRLEYEGASCARPKSKAAK